MNWNFLDIFDILIDLLDLLGNASASSKKKDHPKTSVKEKTKYPIEK
ncbi:hypothetical protein [Chryseobacterium sp. SN22]|nr:hypothetical protein [Chryseobacterium sp. SN22]